MSIQLDQSAPEAGEPASKAGHSADSGSTASRADGEAPENEVDLQSRFADYDPESRDALRGSQQVVEALKFARDFVLPAEADFSWIIADAKHANAALMADFKEADDKASSVIVFVSSGIGVFTFANILALASGNLSPWVVLAIIPSFALALKAVSLALSARRPLSYPGSPTARQAMEFVVYYGVKAQVEMMGQWELTNAGLRVINGVKCGYVRKSMEKLLYAVRWLALPLIVALLMKAF